MSRGSGIPLERLIESTSPNQHDSSGFIIEQIRAVRKRVELGVVYPNAAGIDIGASGHFVAVPPQHAQQVVREFGSFTGDLNQLSARMKDCGVDTAVMESSGVYWIPVYEFLESQCFTVFLVNARHVKNVAGKKSDVLDCQWRQQLMRFGLLAAAFRADEQVTYCARWPASAPA